MTITLENCGILREDILNGVVNRLVEPMEDDIQNAAIKATHNKIEELVGKKVETIVADAITAKVCELMASEVQPLNIWGEKRGKPRTINDILSDSLQTYWAEKVDRNGKKTDSYNAYETRVEHMVKKVANDVLKDSSSKEFQQLILDTKAKLSDSLSEAVKKVTDAAMGIKRK